MAILDTNNVTQANVSDSAGNNDYDSASSHIVDKIILDIMNVILGQLAFLSNIAHFSYIIKKQKINKVNQLTAAYALGCAAIGWGYTLECNLCTRVWSDGEKTIGQCMLLAPNAVMYVSGLLLISLSTFIMGSIALATLRPVSHSVAQHKYGLVEVGCILTMPTIVAVALCYYISLTSGRAQEITHSCYYSSTVLSDFGKWYDLCLCLLNTITTIFFTSTVITIHCQSSKANGIRKVTLKRRSQVFRKVAQPMLYSFITFNIASIADYISEEIDFDAGIVVEYLYLLQPMAVMMLPFLMQYRAKVSPSDQSKSSKAKTSITRRASTTWRNLMFAQSKLEIATGESSKPEGEKNDQKF